MHRSVRLSLRAFVFIAVFSSTNVFGSSLWFGDNDGLHQIDTSANRVVLDVAFEPPVSIAINAADGSVWALTQSRLARLNAQGVVQVQRELRDLGNGIGAPRLLVLNPNDASVWAAFENRVLHFDDHGVLLLSLAIAAEDLAIAQDGSLWVLSQSSVQQFDSAGTRVRNVPSTGGMQAMKYLALDDTGGAIWLAGAKNLLELNLSDPSQTMLVLGAPEPTSAISVDMQTGDLWVLGQNTLSSYRRDGTPVVSRDLRDFSISNPQTLVFDFASQAAWVGHQGGLSRIASNGTLSAAFPATPHVRAIAIGRTPVNIEPVVMLVSPADGSLLNNPTPQFRVKYDALCGGVSCGFPNSFFSSFSLSASLNGTEVGSLFVFDPATGGASFTPRSPLPEGRNVFSAQARDAFGHLSNTVSASFTIDTIAPSFRDVAPPSGSVFTTSSSVTITGSVDDPTAIVTLGAQSQGASFSFTVTLTEGVNNFTLLARDSAGNTAAFPLTYTFAPPANSPPTAAITSPTNGTPFSAPASIFVAATAQDSDGTIARVDFLRNGVVAATDTTFPYEATLTNVPAGTQTLTARAVDDRGGTTTSVAVTVSVTATSVTITSPAPNAVISGDNVLVTGRIVALPNSGVSVNNFVASLDASGNFTVLIPLAAGVNSITAKLTTADGTVLTQTISVLATGTSSPFAVGADPLIGIAPLTVVFRISNPTAGSATVSSNIFFSFVLPAGSTAQGSAIFPAGVFVPTFTFSSALGTFTHRLVVESRDTTQMDQVFRSIWSGLNTALSAGDEPGAMRYLNGNAKRRFGPVFDVLMPFMSQIVASYSTLARSSITSDVGTYAVVRLDNGTRRLYFIYFMRDPDGVWRIDEM